MIFIKDVSKQAIFKWTHAWYPFDTQPKQSKWISPEKRRNQRLKSILVVRPGGTQKGRKKYFYLRVLLKSSP